jgi:hypothetical protein
MKGKSGTDMAKQKSLAELLAKQPPALQASKNAEALETPFFDQVVEQADSTATASFEALLTEITGAVDPANIPRFPTSQCLSPEDVYNLESIGLQQQDHLSGCPWCKNMVLLRSLVKKSSPTCWPSVAEPVVPRELRGIEKQPRRAKTPT